MLENESGSQKHLLERLEAKIDKLFWWIVGIILSVAGSAVMLLVAIVLNKPHG